MSLPPKLSLALLLVMLSASVTIAAGGGRGRGGGAPVGTGPRPPAPTLMPATSPTTKPDDEGFIRRWLILEPLPANGVAEPSFRAVVAKEHFPNQLTMIPHDAQKITADGTEVTWHACDTTRYNINLYHFSYALNKPTNGVFWWVVTVIDSPEEMKNVRLAIGSNDASIWWLNGEELVGLFNNRMDTVDDGVSKRVILKKGQNVIRAAITNEMGPTDFCGRLLDANDQPVKNITITLPEAPK